MTEASPVIRSARNPTSPSYPFELRNGGLGVSISVTTSSSRVAFPSVEGGNLTIYNDGPNTVWVTIGGSSVAATTSGTPIGTGIKETFTIMSDDALGLPGYAYAAAITRTGTAFVTFNRGDGV